MLAAGVPGTRTKCTPVHLTRRAPGNLYLSQRTLLHCRLYAAWCVYTDIISTEHILTYPLDSMQLDVFSGYSKERTVAMREMHALSPQPSHRGKEPVYAADVYHLTCRRCKQHRHERSYGEVNTLKMMAISKLEHVSIIPKQGCHLASKDTDEWGPIL